MAALALLTLVFDLAGLGPFSSDNGGPVQAGSNCHTVVIAKRERQPVTVNGQLAFRYRTVHRHVTRCH